MSAYAVTRDGRIIEYRAGLAGKQLWMQDQGEYWLLYQYSCGCQECGKEDHRYWVAQVLKSSVVSFGWERPICVEGRLLTAGEKSDLINIRDWLNRRKEKNQLPWKVERHLQALEKVAK